MEVYGIWTGRIYGNFILQVGIPTFRLIEGIIRSIGNRRRGTEDGAVHKILIGTPNVSISIGILRSACIDSDFLIRHGVYIVFYDDEV